MKTRKEYSERKLMRVLEENKDKAKAFLDDDAKMEKLFRDFEVKLKLIPKIGKRASDIAVLLSMTRAYIKKQYTDVSMGTILLAIGGLLYIVAPTDIVPDFILGTGLLDDAAVLGVILQAMHIDLKKYKKWQADNGRRDAEEV